MRLQNVDIGPRGQHTPVTLGVVNGHRNRLDIDWKELWFSDNTLFYKKL